MRGKISFFLEFLNGCEERKRAVFLAVDGKILFFFLFIFSLNRVVVYYSRILELNNDSDCI